MTQIIGIDVGGTHADGVLLNGNQLLAKKKVSVDEKNLAATIIFLLKSLLANDSGQLARIHLSTTLCTNAIVKDELDPVGMLIQAGPGMNPDFLNCGDHTVFLDGTIDHRGHIIKNPSSSLVKTAAKTFQQQGIKSVGIVTKFSHRNSSHEQQIHDLLRKKFPHLSTGHRISGQHNFPRRVYTTWLNAALKSTFLHFQEAIGQGLKELGIRCPCYILKADGGTMPFESAGHIPCESIHSGPSASVMGCLALHERSHDAVLLDIGGTTTDISLLTDGVPLLERYGVTVNGRPTLIRALNTRSVGLGGDSSVRYSFGKFFIGPRKMGPPVALGGQVPTPTDAMILLGRVDAGDRDAAQRAMRTLVPDQAPEETAKGLLTQFTRAIRDEVEQMLEEVFSRPVFTVSALLNRKRLRPKEIVTVGGPAMALQNDLAEIFKLPCSVPDHFEVANAIGAARTRPTIQASLYADSADQSLSIPETGLREKIKPDFLMADAEKKLTEVIQGLANKCGIKNNLDIDFYERQEMNTISGFRSTGKIIYLKAQIQPGLERL